MKDLMEEKKKSKILVSFSSTITNKDRDVYYLSVQGAVKRSPTAQGKSLPFPSKMEQLSMLSLFNGLPSVAVKETALVNKLK